MVSLVWYTMETSYTVIDTNIHQKLLSRRNKNLVIAGLKLVKRSVHDKSDDCNHSQSTLIVKTLEQDLKQGMALC